MLTGIDATTGGWWWCSCESSFWYWRTTMGRGSYPSLKASESPPYVAVVLSCRPPSAGPLAGSVHPELPPSRALIVIVRHRRSDILFVEVRKVNGEGHVTMSIRPEEPIDPVLPPLGHLLADPFRP